MRNVNKNTGQPIYHLIAVLEDAKKGYLNAAEKIKDEVLALLFEKFSYQKSRYISELQQVAERSGFSSAIDRFTLSLLHRTWMDLKSSFRFGQQEAVIKACIKGEESAIANYADALEEIGNDDEVRVILMQQVNGINTALKTIKEYTSNLVTIKK
jgi:uncharacterized protein (TIGR02284 family)